MDKLLKQIGFSLQKELMNKLIEASQEADFDKETFFTEDNLTAIFSDAAADMKNATKKTKKKKTTGPKKTNTWILFMAEHRQMVKDENPQAKFQDIAKLISVKWKALTVAEKDVYKVRAAEINKQNGLTPPNTPSKTKKVKAPPAPKKAKKPKMTDEEKKAKARERAKKKREEKKAAEAAEAAAAEEEEEEEEEEEDEEEEEEEEEEEDILADLNDLIEEEE